MAIECNYSFQDLYFAAFGHKPPLKEKIKLQKLSQEEINVLVRTWAEKAGWKTQKKKGTDKNVYLSFHP
jgi:hypothetical protein